jgi:hypothetical protein
MLRILSLVVSALIASLNPVYSQAVELPVIDKSERDQYWLEKEPLNFSLWYPSMPLRLYTMTGFCFNATFIIDSSGAAELVDILKFEPVIYDRQNRRIPYDTTINFLTKRIQRIYRFQPAPGNIEKQAIRTNVLFYQEGQKKHKDYISDISTACELPLKQTLESQDINSDVNMEDIKATGMQELEKFYTTKTCEHKRLDCACARKAFIDQWIKLGVGARVNKINYHEIQASCAIPPSEETILLKMKPYINNLRLSHCTQPKWKNYDCDCFEKVYTEAWLNLGEAGTHGAAYKAVLQRSNECRQ